MADNGGQRYRVAIIGAGFGGLGMAIRLKRAGITDFVIPERAAGIGGTWRDNSYPGLSCDIPSHLYSFSFWPGRWSKPYPERDEIPAYPQGSVTQFGLGPHLRRGPVSADCNGVVTAESPRDGALFAAFTAARSLLAGVTSPGSAALILPAAAPGWSG